MNMKKTMAAIAACAVAVSAMATTVSALEDQSFAYDLKAEKVVKTAGSVVLSGTITNATVDATTELVLGFADVPAGYTLKTLTATFKDTSGGAGNKVFTFTTDKSDNYIGSFIDGNSYVITKASLATLTTQTALYDIVISGKFEFDGKTDATNPDGIDKVFDATNADNYTADTDATPADKDTTVVYVANTATGLKDKDDAATTVLADTNAHFTALAATTKNDVLASSFVKAGETKYEVPFMTSLKDNDEILSYLENNTKKKYLNVTAVLNDAIENYETVTFTFNTATTKVQFLVGADNVKKDTFKDAYLEAKGDLSLITPIYTQEDKGEDYTKFGQHLYNDINGAGLFQGEGTNWVGFDWNANNLFQGGLVINERLTMSLSDVTTFDWNATSVSFDWDTIMDEVATTNNFATYLHKMELATSNTWFWDNMTVSLVAGAVDDATSDAGAEADDEVLDDEAAEEEVVEEEVVEEEVVEEEVTEEVEEEAEVEVEVENPTTGNASVALAVIPVALAAAAIVAKKRS